MAAPSVYFVSLGCPKNRVDTEVMLGMSQQAGYQVTTAPEEADVIVVNTCGFIAEAKEESIDTILEMAQYKQTGRCRRLIVTGCLSQRYPVELQREIPEIDHLLGSGEVDKVVAAMGAEGQVLDVAEVPSYLYDDRTVRAASQGTYSRYVKIAEGCDRPCGFCIIPKLRGPQRSRTIESVAREVDELSRRGAVEINLVAQDLTAYGRDLPPPERTNLVQLLRRIGGPAPGSLRWLRLHYAYPSAVTDELLDVIAQMPRVVKYLDVPLQHVDDDLLKLMRRGHVGRTVWRLVERARQRVPGITLRTTFIVGHPGETEGAFARLCEFVRQAEFDRIGVFTYSREEGTHSATLTNEVPPREAERRRRELMRLQRGLSRKRLRAMVGRELEVLVEGAAEESEFVLRGRHAGQAPEIDGCVYLTLGEAAPDLALRPGDLVRARVCRYSDYDLQAEVLGLVQRAPRPAVHLNVVR
ncbi:MAG: 30S ribosomal protein S12 methylthiotransferase RimO [Myxococcales bacterium]|nr:30S ribosomal protein S12 methylthiotransferase RimO [Myxococcota bacterium]MDW8284192.1 30S ribosomal protein S12 methylthiotransferase RimO [Myxococcales bacterium]